MAAPRRPQVPLGAALPAFLVVCLLVVTMGTNMRSASASFLSTPALYRSIPAIQDTALLGATFDSAWVRVRDTHYDPAMAGLDWSEIRRELRPTAVATATRSELRAVLTEMLSRLGQSHFAIIPGGADPGMTTSGPQPLGDADPGIDVRWLDSELVVSRVRRGAPADRAGIRPGWRLLRIGDETVDSMAATVRRATSGSEGGEFEQWMVAEVRSRLLGMPDAPVRLTLTSGPLAPFDLTVSRDPPIGERVEFGNLPPMRVETWHAVERLSTGASIGIIRMSAWFPAAVPAFANAMDELREADGIIIDLRGNPGGIGALTMGIAGHFLSEPESLGVMRTRQTSLDFMVNPQRIGTDGRRVEPYAGPLLILVDPLTASTSEIFAAGLQALGRAEIVGETTAGQALPAVTTTLPNGDHLLHAVADFTAPDGSRLEGRGIEPDIEVDLTPERFLTETDPTLARAIERLGGP